MVFRMSHGEAKAVSRSRKWTLDTVFHVSIRETTKSSTNACLFRNGPTSSSNERGRLSGKGVIIKFYEALRKLRMRQTRQNLMFSEGQHLNNLREHIIIEYNKFIQIKIKKKN